MFRDREARDQISRLKQQVAELTSIVGTLRVELEVLKAQPRSFPLTPPGEPLRVDYLSVRKLRVEGDEPGDGIFVYIKRKEGSPGTTAIVVRNDTDNPCTKAIQNGDAAAHEVDQLDGEDAFVAADIDGVGGDGRFDNVIGRRLCVSPGGQIDMAFGFRPDGKINYERTIYLNSMGHLVIERAFGSPGGPVNWSGLAITPHGVDVRDFTPQTYDAIIEAVIQKLKDEEAKTHQPDPQ